MNGAPRLHTLEFLRSCRSRSRTWSSAYPPLFRCHCQLPSTRGMRIEVSGVDARLRSSLGRGRGACHRGDGRRVRDVHVRCRRASACFRRHLEQPLVPLVVLCGNLLYKQLDLRRLRGCRLLGRCLRHNDVLARRARSSARPARRASGSSRAPALMASEPAVAKRGTQPMAYRPVATLSCSAEPRPSPVPRFERGLGLMPDGCLYRGLPDPRSATECLPRRPLHRRCCRGTFIGRRGAHSLGAVRVNPTWHPGAMSLAMPPTHAPRSSVAPGAPASGPLSSSGGATLSVAPPSAAFLPRWAAKFFATGARPLQHLPALILLSETARMGPLPNDNKDRSLAQGLTLHRKLTSRRQFRRLVLSGAVLPRYQVAFFLAI